MRQTLVLSILFVLAILGACGDDDGTATETKVFTDEDSTSDAIVAPGERFEVQLESNPSTGFGWQMAEMAATNLVDIAAHNYVEPNSDLVGAAGTEVWEFTAGAEGAGVLRLEYVRPSDDPPIPERVFELIVRIDDADWPPADAVVPTVDVATAPTTIAELLSSATPRDTVVVGSIVWTEAEARLCEALAESFPPQCGGASILIVDPDELDIELQRAEGVRWTDLPIELIAYFDGVALCIGGR